MQVRFEDLEKLLKLQSVDVDIIRVQKEIDDLPQRAADLHHAREGDICGDGGGARLRRVARVARPSLDLHTGTVGIHFATHRLDDLAGRLARVRAVRPGGPLGEPVGVLRARIAAALLR